MYFAIGRNDMSVLGTFDDIDKIYRYIDKLGKSADDYYIAEEFVMKYISRVVTFNGKYIYNNVDFWKSAAWNDRIIMDYDETKVLDILGQPVSKERFLQERYTNFKRIQLIDGRPGQIDYNMIIGKEFVSLFREECILTKFTKDSNTSPMKIFEKLSTVIAMLDAGAFREAKQCLVGYKQLLIDDFLTEERLDKYIAMLDAADAIEYATEEDYFYVVPM